MLQISTYLPCLRLKVCFLLLPAPTSSISPILPVSEARLLATGSLEAPLLVLMIASSCSIWPVFLTVNVTLPAETLLGEGETLNSLRVTAADFVAASEEVAIATAAITAASTAMMPSRPARRCEREDMRGSTQTPHAGSASGETPLKICHLSHQCTPSGAGRGLRAGS